MHLADTTAACISHCATAYGSYLPTDRSNGRKQSREAALDGAIEATDTIAH